VKFVLLFAVPRGVTTVTKPVVAVVGTVAVIWVNESTVKVVASKPLKRTAVTPAKLLPVIVTTVPTAPLDGVNEAMAGSPVPVRTNCFTGADVPTAPSLSVARAVRTYSPLVAGTVQVAS
jgi:hypothetical protein